MTLSELFTAQITDPFRLVLIAGLLFTLWRTHTRSGTWIPLCNGVLFIAVLIPLTTQPLTVPSFPIQILSGILVNLIWITAPVGLWFAQKRRTKQT